MPRKCTRTNRPRSEDCSGGIRQCAPELVPLDAPFGVYAENRWFARVFPNPARTSSRDSKSPSSGIVSDARFDVSYKFTACPIRARDVMGAPFSLASRGPSCERRATARGQFKLGLADFV